MIKRGFELVFAEPKAGNGGPALVTDPDGPFARSFADLVKNTGGLDDLPTKAREDLGRRVILNALKGDGIKLLSGFEGDTRTAQADVQGDGDEAPSSPTPPRQSDQPEQESVRVDENPWPETPVTREFRDAIHQRESAKGNYQAVNSSGDAWGRYQLTKIARKQIGIEDENGKPTGKYGIHNREDFLNNPTAQEKAFADYMKDNKRLLKSNGALGRAGQKIEGIKGKITITESGLLAAAHREGATAVKRYLVHQEAHGWESNFSDLDKKPRQTFLRVETRLREFEGIPHDRR
jgi:hypothetical protein